MNRSIFVFYTRVRKAKTTKNWWRCSFGCKRAMELWEVPVGMQTVQSFWKTVWQLLIRLNIKWQWKWKVNMLVARSCLALCYPMDCSPPGFSVPGILQARILEWVAIPFSRGSSQPRDQTWVSCIAGRFLPSEPPGKPRHSQYDLTISRYLR